MAALESMFESQTLTRSQVLTFGTVAVGSIEILDAFIFYGFRGVNPLRIPQSIATGILGRAAYYGGVKTALLGIVLHFFFAFIIVLAYYAASRKITQLCRTPFVYGPLYGLIVWEVMSWIVLPPPRFATAHLLRAGWINGIVIYTLGIGLITAIFASFAPVNPVPASPSGREDAA